MQLNTEHVANEEEVAAALYWRFAFKLYFFFKFLTETEALKSRKSGETFKSEIKNVFISLLN